MIEGMIIHKRTLRSPAMTEFVDFVSLASSATPEAAAIAAASQCLDRFTDRFNACDLAGMDGELLFPARHVLWSFSS